MPKSKKELKATRFTATWKKGLKVVKILYGSGHYREATLGEVTKVDPETNTVYFNDETGVTFDSEGREKENFFPPLRTEIIPLQ